MIRGMERFFVLILLQTLTLCRSEHLTENFLLVYDIGGRFHQVSLNSSKKFIFDSEIRGTIEFMMIDRDDGEWKVLFKRKDHSVIDVYNLEKAKSEPTIDMNDQTILKVAKYRGSPWYMYLQFKFDVRNKDSTTQRKIIKAGQIIDMDYVPTLNKLFLLEYRGDDQKVTSVNFNEGGDNWTIESVIDKLWINYCRFIRVAPDGKEIYLIPDTKKEIFRIRLSGDMQPRAIASGLCENMAAGWQYLYFTSDRENQWELLL